MLEVSNLRKSYGDRLLIDDLSFSIPKGAIVGIIGPTGAGKSTLFRMISGQEQPDSGTITLGETVKLASVDQFRDSMDNSKTVWEEVSGGLDIMKIGNTEMPSRAYVGRFNFKGVTLFRMISGQEQPDSGTITLGETVKLASVDQFRDSMDNSKTVWEDVSGGLDLIKICTTEMPSRAYVGRFNFKGVDQGKRVGELSGGERGRLHLAKLLQVGGNMRW